MRLNSKPNILERIREKQAKALGRQYSKSDKPVNKGFFMGSCNRSACLRPNARWYNHGSLAYYCEACAMDLNHDTFNRREALDEWGHLLCTEGEYDPEKYRRIHDLHNNAKRDKELYYFKGQIGEYHPEENEHWSGYRQFTVSERVLKTAPEICVKFFDGERTIVKMSKVTMSNRGIKIE